VVTNGTNAERSDHNDHRYQTMTYEPKNEGGAGKEWLMTMFKHCVWFSGSPLIYESRFF
jgi:hypothetical protein